MLQQVCWALAVRSRVAWNHNLVLHVAASKPFLKVDLLPNRVLKERYAKSMRITVQRFQAIVGRDTWKTNSVTIFGSQETVAKESNHSKVVAWSQQPT